MLQLPIGNDNCGMLILINFTNTMCIVCARVWALCVCMCVVKVCEHSVCVHLIYTIYFIHVKAYHLCVCVCFECV